VIAKWRPEYRAIQVRKGRENSMFEGFVVGGVRPFEEVRGGPRGSRGKTEGK